MFHRFKFQPLKSIVKWIIGWKTFCWLCKGSQVSCRFFCFAPISSWTEWRYISTARLPSTVSNVGIRGRNLGFLGDESFMDSMFAIFSVTKGRQRCWILGFFSFGDEFHKENLHLRGWNFGEQLNQKRDLNLRWQKNTVFRLTISFKSWKFEADQNIYIQVVQCFEGYI